MAALPFFLILSKNDRTGGRIIWMQWMSRRFLSILNCRVDVTGNVPAEGLVASNHLGYADILVIGSVCPALFVAKSDVKDWPVFGWLTRGAGTIFVSRDNPSEVPAQLRRMEKPLGEGIPVVLFPEGTSSGGESVLPLRSSLLEAAVRSGRPVTPVAVSYDLKGGGDVGQEIAYWGEAILLTHLLNLLSKPSFRAQLRFGETRDPMPNRKEESSRLHAEITHLLRSVT